MTTRTLTYPVALYLSLGDIFQLFNANLANSVLGQQFSVHYIGDAVTGFSVRYTGSRRFSRTQSLFAASAAGRTTNYYKGGGYTDNGYTAPLTGLYQVSRPERHEHSLTFTIFCDLEQSSYTYAPVVHHLIHVY